MDETLVAAIRAKIAADSVFADKLRAVGSREEAIELVRSAGIDVPASIAQSRELTNEELSSISGGTSYCGSGFSYD